jgi:nitrite reductase/ring-hydroxylating ferredoxin subunit
MSNIQPIGLATAIDPNQAIAAICGGQEFAVWRDTHGALHANQNRCPHRGMRLHLGFVRDDRLHCAYHGWSYDSGGQCRQIPAHPQLAPAKTICLQTYPVAERHALLWLAVDADRVALDAGLAAIVLPAGIDATPVRSLYVAAEMAVVRRAMATLHVPPCAEPGAASALVDADSESATWSIGERRLPVVYMRTLAAPGVGTIVVRGEGLRPQGLLYALQNAGGGRTGIHVCALWEGAAPVAYRRLLSRHLRRVEWFLAHADQPSGPWRAFAAAAA